MEIQDTLLNHIYTYIICNIKCSNNTYPKINTQKLLFCTKFERVFRVLNDYSGYTLHELYGYC